MKTYQHLPLYTFLFATLGLIACGKQDDTVIGRQAPLSGTIIASVNDIEITEPELKLLLQSRQSAGQTITRESGIDELIGVELLRQQAIVEGLHQDEMLVAEMNRQSMQVLATAMIRKFMKSQVINDQDIFTEYNNYTATLSDKEYKVRHILSKTKREGANNIDDLNRGAAFSELAKKRSIDPSNEQGGEIGWITPQTVVKSFGDALATLQPGHYTKEPVETNYGWHIILLEETRPLSPPALDSIRNQLKNTIINRRIKAYLEDLRDKANVQLTQVDENIKANQTEEPQAQ